jgi:hypothetical protein
MTKAGIRSGVSHTGTFVSGHTLVVRSGKLRDRALTSRPRQSENGYANYNAPARGCRVFRARCAGDANAKAGLLPSVVAFGRYISGIRHPGP